MGTASRLRLTAFNRGRTVGGGEGGMIPETMTGVQLTGYGGLDKLVLRDDIPTPRPGPGDVLIAVAAAGMNNTDINTRTGWYSQAVDSGTTAEGGQQGFGVSSGGMGGWGRRRQLSQDTRCRRRRDNRGGG